MGSCSLGGRWAVGEQGQGPIAEEERIEIVVVVGERQAVPGSHSHGTTGAVRSCVAAVEMREMRSSLAVAAAVDCSRRE